MNKKSIFTFAISMLLGIVAGAFIVWTVTAINKKNSEIASLKEQISSDTIAIPVAEFEGRISAEITGDSIHVVNKSVKIKTDKN